MKRAPAYRAVVRAGAVSLTVGTLILAIKFAAWFITGSSVLLADALESIVNVIAAAMATYSVAVAARPADDDHPYGHGKAETLSAAIEGTLIGVAATLIVIEAVRKIMVGPELAQLGTGIAISGVAGLGNLFLGLYLVRVGSRERSEAIQADGSHILADVATTVGGIAALLLVRATGVAVIDPIMALIVALNILYAGWRVVRRALGGLLDEADFGFLQRITRHLEDARQPDWVEIHELRARRSGASHHIDLHLTVPRYHSMEKAHRIADDLENSLQKFVGPSGSAVVHLDPCRPNQCSSCAMPDCHVRASELHELHEFNLESLTKLGRI